MDLSPDILTRGERAVLTLRQLYEGYGYRRYRVGEVGATSTSPFASPAPAR